MSITIPLKKLNAQTDAEHFLFDNFSDIELMSNVKIVQTHGEWDTEEGLKQERMRVDLKTRTFENPVY